MQNQTRTGFENHENESKHQSVQKKKFRYISMLYIVACSRNKYMLSCNLKDIFTENRRTFTNYKPNSWLCGTVLLILMIPEYYPKIISAYYVCDLLFIEMYHKHSTSLNLGFLPLLDFFSTKCTKWTPTCTRHLQENTKIIAM